jgi:hypothetical protein
MKFFSGLSILAAALGSTAALQAQTWVQPQVWVDAHGPLDPARELPLAAEPERALLPEQYIWTANDAFVEADGGRSVHHEPNEKLEPRYFRTAFELKTVPARATLYVAGPRQARIFVNGKLVAEPVGHPASWSAFETFIVDVSSALQAGRNTLAIEAVRGTTHNHHTNLQRTKQLNVGQVLVAKILPAGPAELAEPVMISNTDWRSTVQAAEGWQTSSFDDSAWPRVHSLGGIESSAEFYQWHADSGLTNWPGYIGVSSSMRCYLMLPVQAEVQTAGGAQFERLANLTRLQMPTDAEQAMVHLPATRAAGTPAILLDFGKEVAGRLLVRNGGKQLAKVTIRYGESMEELLNAPFMGDERMLVPPEGVARGIKSAFRYALIKFPEGTGEVHLRQVVLEGIAYPVRYKASFESSDPLLNRIWQSAAYTAHLAMQEGVWDGVKRDRGKWMGDNDVTTRVMDALFGDGRLSEQTFLELAGKAPYSEHVNGLAPYTAFWVMGEAAHYRRIGSSAGLEAIREPLKGLLGRMDRDVDDAGLFVNPNKMQLFVDWAPNFDRDTPDARRAIQFEYLLAFADGAELMTRLQEPALAAKYKARAEQMKRAAEEHLVDPATGTFGPYWQANAMAVVANAVSPERGRAIYDHVLSGVGAGTERMQQVTPYYGYYVMEALTRLGHQQQALDWMRQYWGGMLELGATSFWEAYDPRWPRVEPHKYLEADHKKGYYVSLAHGWSSGPALWLLEHVAGLQSTDAGGHHFVIHPELGNLRHVMASIPAGDGILSVAIDGGNGTKMTVDVPDQCTATVELPRTNAAQKVFVNGHEVAAVELDHAGRYEIAVR